MNKKLFSKLHKALKQKNLNTIKVNKTLVEIQVSTDINEDQKEELLLKELLRIVED